MFGKKWKLKAEEVSRSLEECREKGQDLEQRLTASEQAREAAQVGATEYEVKLVELRSQYAKVCSELGEMRAKFKGPIDMDALVERAESRLSATNGAIETAEEKLRESEQEVAEYLEVLGVVGAQAFATAELQLNPALVLRESEERVKTVQVDLDRAKKADVAIVESVFSMNGSLAEGKKYQTQVKRLAKMALDGAVQLSLGKITIKTADSHKARIEKAHEQINMLIDATRVRLTDGYLDYCLLMLDHKVDLLQREAARKAVEKQERDVMREEARREREERKLREDAEKAAAEEARMARLLEAVRREAEAAIGAKREELDQRIADMTQALAVQHERVEKANSMAQLTRSGHVYVISNHGSFGADCYKIGMTRRLVPEDRVKELGDASVPFTFDTHAMIYSENAPALETALHEIFDDRRVNLVNRRKEFFSVSIDEVVQALRERGVDAEVRKTALAEEYRETQRLLALAAGDRRGYLQVVG